MRGSQYRILKRKMAKFDLYFKEAEWKQTNKEIKGFESSNHNWLRRLHEDQDKITS
jgi:transposase-like protein